jgi:GntR family transcriptional regulator, transcriptional repressor for pyruvate dehydrogenase complex
MEFKEIQKFKFKKKSSFIAEQIIHQIKNNSTNTGQKLPSERELSEMMKVSRPSVREALSALQIVGILESRPGAGIYVTERGSSEVILQRALSLLEEADSPYEDIQLRKVFEIGCIYLAIKNATEVDITSIKAAWNEHKNFGDKHLFKEFIQSSTQFHMSIAQATRNKTIINFMKSLILMVENPLWLGMRIRFFEEDPERINSRIKLHSEIVNAIELRSIEEAMELMEKHFDAMIDQQYDNVG